LLFHPICLSDLAMAEAKRNRIHWLVLAALCLSAHTAVFAQSGPAQSVAAQSDPAQSPPQRSVQIQSPQSGSLAGRLTDLHSAPLAGVTLVLRNQTTGAEIRTSTSKNGVFRFRSLDAASYTLDADAAKLGHGRLEGIVVTGGTESRVQAAMVFDPAAPAPLQASVPPQISVTPATFATVPHAAASEIAASQIAALRAVSPSIASVPAPSFAATAPIVVPNPPPAILRPALNTTSPQLIASIPLLVPSDAAQLRPLPLKASTPAIALTSSVLLTLPTRTPLQFVPQPEPYPQIAAPAAALLAFAPTVTAPLRAVPAAVSTATPASPTIAASPSEPAPPSAIQPAQPRRIAAPLRPVLETQSATMQLALSIAPQRPFQLKAAAPSVLAATATLPVSVMQAALLNPASLNPALLNPLPVAATIAAAKPPDPVTPAVTTTITAAQLQALPASGRRWQDFLLDTAAAGPSADGLQTSYRGSQQSAGIAVDGINTSLAFGVFAGSGLRASDSTGADSDPQSATMQSGSQAWTGGRGLGVSEAAIREVTAASGNVEADEMRSADGRTTISTESGSNAIHGQGFLFDRQNTWGARNPYTQWVTETAPADIKFDPLGSAPVFTPEPYTPPDHETVWGLGIGGDIRRNKLFWFTALDSYRRNDPGLAMVKHPLDLCRSFNTNGQCAYQAGFFETPSNCQLEALSARLGFIGGPSSDCASALALGLTAYSTMLDTLSGLLGPAPRTAAQWVGFGRIDWQATERHHFTFEDINANWNSPGGGLTRLSETYGNHSFGSSQASQQWLLARWEAYLTPNLLAVTQGSAGLAVLSAKPGAPSAFEQCLLNNSNCGLPPQPAFVNPYGQLPQIVVDNRYGLTIGNPARFGQGDYPDEHVLHGQQMLSWVHNKLLVTAGFELDHNADAITQLRNQTGTYVYSKVEDFISDALVFQQYGLQNPNTDAVEHSCGATDTDLGSEPCYTDYSQIIGPTNWNLSSNDWAGYGTFQWQPNKLTVFSVGLRWEREQMPPPLAALVNLDLPHAGKMPVLGNNWGPRVSLAIGSSRSRWPVLRLGYGAYYGVVANATTETALTQTGSLNGDLSYFIRPTDGNSFLDGTRPAPPFPYALDGPPASIVKPGAVEFATNFRNPEIHQAVAAIEQPLPAGIQLTASMMLSLGRRLPVFIDSNLAPPTNPQSQQPQTITYNVCDETPPTPTGSPNANGPCGNLGLGPIKAPQITVPFYASTASTGVAGWVNPDYQQVNTMESKANSTYEAAMVKLTRNSSRGLSLHANYTYAHAMDWNPNESPLDPVDTENDFSQEYGTSNLDVRHSAAAMIAYAAPWKLRGFAGGLGNGWALSGIGQFHSGLPFTMLTSGSLPEEFTSSSAAIIGLGPGINGSGGDNRVYGLGSDGHSYNVGRNTFRYPNVWKADLRLAKRFDLGETRQLEILAESFNLFNHQNVTEIETTGYIIEPGSPPSTSGGSATLPTLNFLTGLKINSKTGLPNPAFGQPLNINGSDFYRERQIQIGLRMRF
jgi:Carboxypeptidase regulatory-like domain